MAAKKRKQPLLFDTNYPQGLGRVDIPRQITPVLGTLVEERRIIEERLLSVDLMDANGTLLWTCHDIRQGRHTVLEQDIDTPSYEDGHSLWRKNVWTIPVNSSGSLVLNRRCMVQQVRIGLSQWKAVIGKDIGTNFKYDTDKQFIERVSFPLTTAEHGQLVTNHRTTVEPSWDNLGEHGLYVTGPYKVTGLEMLTCFHAEDDQGEGFDILRHIPNADVFPGADDELHVQYVHLALSGVLLNTLKLFHCIDESNIEKETNLSSEYARRNNNTGTEGN